MDKNTIFTTPTFRVSFPYVFTPQPSDGDGKDKYNLTMLFDVDALKADPKELALFNAIQGGIAQMQKQAFPGMKFPSLFRKGSEKLTQAGERYAGYDDNVVWARISSERKPGIVDRDAKTPLLHPHDVYAGMYARATINIYSWTYKAMKRGVSLGLQNIQKVKDGEPFTGGGQDPSQAFDAITSPDDSGILGEQEAPVADDMADFLS